MSELTVENDKLRALIQKLLRHRFGRRSEQLSPDQLKSAITPAATPIAIATDSTGQIIAVYVWTCACPLLARARKALEQVGVQVPKLG